MLVLSNSSFAFFKHFFVYHVKTFFISLNPNKRKIKKGQVHKKYSKQMHANEKKKKKYNKCHMFPPLMHLPL